MNKNILILGLVFLFCISFAHADLNTSQISYYKFDGDATDSHGTKDLTVTGATQTQNGIINQGYSFDGDNDVLTSSSTTWGISNVFSVSFWFSNTLTTSKRILMVRTASTTPNLMGVSTQTSGKLYVDLYSSAGSNFKGYLTSSALNDGNLHHFVYTWDGTNLKLYVDGTEDTPTKSVDNAGTMTDTSRTFYWGNNHNNGADFTGIIDEVGLWNRVLNSTEISQLYNSGSALQYPYIISSSDCIYSGSGDWVIDEDCTIENSYTIESGKNLFIRTGHTVFIKSGVTIN